MSTTSLIIPTRLAERVLSNEGIYTGRCALDMPLTRTAGGKWRYPLRTMLVGQHFFVPADYRSVKQVQNSLSSSVCHVQNTSDRKFHQRRYLRGIRVWRTK